MDNTFLGVRNQDSHQYETMGKIIEFHIPVFRFLLKKNDQVRKYSELNNSMNFLNVKVTHVTSPILSHHATHTYRSKGKVKSPVLN
jgi:hypothetical protein